MSTDLRSAAWGHRRYRQMLRDMSAAEALQLKEAIMPTPTTRQGTKPMATIGIAIAAIVVLGLIATVLEVVVIAIKQGLP